MKTLLTDNQLKNRYPFTPFPTGWYRIAKSHHLSNKDIKKIFYFGRELILKKSKNAEITLTDNHKYYPVIEKNKLIFAYFDSQGKESNFCVPEIAEFTDNGWMKPFNLNWKIKVHIQEVAENALDLSHFTTVHTYLDIPKLSLFKMDGSSMTVDINSRRKHMGVIVNTAMRIIYHGIGIVVADTNTDTSLFLRVLLTTTPIDETHVELNMEVAIKKTWNPLRNLFFRLFMQHEIAKEFYYDIPVWESKLYHKHPILCKGENNILRVRNWAKQFYLCEV